MASVIITMPTAMFVCNGIRSEYTGFLSTATYIMPRNTNRRILSDLIILFWEHLVCMRDKINVSVCVCA